MKRFLRLLAILFAALLILGSLAAGYLLTGASDAQTRLHYAIRLDDPTAGVVDVTLTITPGPAPFIDLYLRDPVQDGRVRVTGFTASRSGRSLAHWQTLPFFPDVVRVWNGFRSEPVTITYRVDPLWMKGAESPRSYLGPDFAFLRGMVFLYSPLSISEILRPDFDHPTIAAGFAEADVTLPAGWKMVSPYGSGKIATPVANLRNGYFGFGPFDLQEMTIQKTPFLLGVYEGLPADRREALARQIPLLFETMRKQTGFAPVSRTCYWSLAVVPTEPIHGGASGTGSLVTQDDLFVIAHEMFHWWNGATLSTTADANWLKEGFTTYYAAKSLYASGLWSEAEMADEINRFRAKASAVDLVEASNRLVNQNQSDAYDPVYYGGGLLAYRLDGLLHEQGKSLDDLWPLLNNLNHPVSTADFLRVLEGLGGKEVARQADDILHGHLKQ